MINPFDYLYYKLYKISLYSESGKTGTHTAGSIMSVLLSLNFFTVRWWRSNNLESSDKLIYGVCLLILMLIIVVYWILKRDKKVIAKFKNESKKSREIGNLVVICYVILSIVSFILVIK